MSDNYCTLFIVYVYMKLIDYGNGFHLLLILSIFHFFSNFFHFFLFFSILFDFFPFFSIFFRFFRFFRFFWNAGNIPFFCLPQVLLLRPLLGWWWIYLWPHFVCHRSAKWSTITRPNFVRPSDKVKTTRMQPLRFAPQPRNTWWSARWSAPFPALFSTSLWVLGVTGMAEKHRWPCRWPGLHSPVPSSFPWHTWK